MSLRRSFATAFGAVAVLSYASAAQAGPWGLAPGEFYTELSGGFYSTGSYLDANGDRPPLAATFEERSLTSHTEFGWTKPSGSSSLAAGTAIWSKVSLSMKCASPPSL